MVEKQGVEEGTRREIRREITRTRVEYEGIPTKRQHREAADLLDEFLRIKGGRPPGRSKNKESKRYFQIGLAVERAIPRFEALIAKKKSFSKRTQQNKQMLRTKLSREGYSEAEIEAGISAQNPKVAARWFIAIERNLSRDSVATYHKTYLADLHPE